MVYLFISDLHLEESRPDMADLFKEFLKTHTKNDTTLYILGDLFEVWIGDDYHTPFNQGIIQALKQAVLGGMKIYLLPGNRDFLLGKNFFKASGCHQLPDYHVAAIFKTPVLLMHGDTLCTQDEKYMQFRKKTRKWWVKKLFLLKSLETRKSMAEKLRALSKEHTSTSSEHIMDVVQSEVEKKMKEYQVKSLIHGHTHREAIHHFQMNNQTAVRIVLGAWHEKGSVLRWDADGKELLSVERHC